MSRRALIPLVLWVVMTTALAITVCWQARYTITNNVASQLHQNFAQTSSNKTYSGEIYADLKHQLAQQIQTDLSQINISGLIPVVTQCHASRVAFNDESADAGALVARVKFDAYHLVATIHLDCDTQWLALFLPSAFLAALFVIGVIWLPRPTSESRGRWVEILVKRGISSRDAHAFSRNIVALSNAQQSLLFVLLESSDQAIDSLLTWCQQNPANLSEEQTDWFRHAIRTGHTADEALAIAVHPASLTFIPETQQLYVHGMPVTISKTPYFYYLWYANNRCKGDGWMLNPATNKPDAEAAGVLSQLMEQFGGHGKAINDLGQQGLTSKKLDQNRNKIKDELISQLGESLAAPYLFETRRDGKSQRYWYRLASDAPTISNK